MASSRIGSRSNSSYGGLYLSVVEANCRYLYPARYDQEIVVETRIVKTGSRMVEFGYRISSLEPERLVAEISGLGQRRCQKSRFPVT